MKDCIVIFIFILLAWSIYRFFFRLPEWVDELMVKPLIFLTPLVYFSGNKEKFTFKIFGFNKKNLIKNTLIGAGAGFLLIEEYVLTYYFKYNFIRISETVFDFQSLFLVIIVSAATGLVEEIIFRGYFLRRFLEHNINAVMAVCLSTLLFLLIHLPVYIFVFNYSINEAVVGMLLLLQLSLLNGILFVYTRSVTAPAVNHALWNLSQVLLR